jgi:hypothetical protein
MLCRKQNANAHIPRRKQRDADYVSALEDQIATLRKYIADLPHSTPDEDTEIISEPTPVPIPGISTDEQNHLQDTEADAVDLHSGLHPEAPRLEGSEL